MPSETQLRLIFSALGEGVFVADPHGRYLHVNPAGCEMFGYTSDEILALSLPDLLDASEWPRLPGTIEGYADGKVSRSTWRFRRKDGSVFTGELVGGRLPDGRFQSMVRDISESLERENHERMLKREAIHRTKNILAVVQAVARQTAASSPAAFIETFSERIAGLAASHDLFVQNAWSEIGLEALVRAQLAPFAAVGAQRLRIDGPDVHLSPTAAQSIGMTLHELATNAVKYGAFSNDKGAVDLSWAVNSAASPPTFSMTWRESGGPPVAPPQRTGFGTRMISTMTERALEAETSLTFDPGGVVWTLTCALQILMRGSDA